MRHQGLIPEAIVSSPAKRAKQTSELVREAARFEAQIVYDKRIYEASITTLLEVVSEFDASIEKVLLVGHNPGFEALLNHLTGEHQHLPTACLAEIHLRLDNWSNISQAHGTLASLIKPRGLMKDQSRD